MNEPWYVRAGLSILKPFISEKIWERVSDHLRPQGYPVFLNVIFPLTKWRLWGRVWISDKLAIYNAHCVSTRLVSQKALLPTSFPWVFYLPTPQGLFHFPITVVWGDERDPGVEVALLQAYKVQGTLKLNFVSSQGFSLLNWQALGTRLTMHPKLAPRTPNPLP